MKIVLIAQESAGVQTLRLVHGSTHVVTAVLTGTEQETAGRGVTVASVARDLGIRVLPAALVRDRALPAELGDVDVLLNVHSLHLIAPEVLAAPRFGSFNLHPGPLPEYAGLDVPSWAVYHGRDRHGVTVHWMEPGIDTGAIAFSASFPLTPQDTGLTVAAKCVQHGIPLIAELLACLERDPPNVPAVPQDLTRRRYFRRGAPHDGWVPWAAPAATVTAFVRACDYGPFHSPWGLPRASLRGTEIAVPRVAATGRKAAEQPGTVGDRNGDGVLVATADEWVVVRRVLVGGTPSAPHEVLRSGDRFEPALGQQPR